MIEAPAAIALGALIIVETRRWGLRQRIVTEVVELEEGEKIVEDQRQGPFRSWRHERRFTRTAEGETEVSEQIDYELPGGMLGLVLKPAMIEAELRQTYAYRLERITEMLHRHE